MRRVAEPRGIQGGRLDAVVGGEADDHDSLDAPMAEQAVQIGRDRLAGGRIAHREAGIAIFSVGALADTRGVRRRVEQWMELGPQVSATQWTGQGPPSLAKWGVDGGCQSWVKTTRPPAFVAIAISRLIVGTTSAAPATERLPAGSAKFFGRIDDDERGRWVLRLHDPERIARGARGAAFGAGGKEATRSSPSASSCAGSGATVSGATGVHVEQVPDALERLDDRPARRLGAELAADARDPDPQVLEVVAVLRAPDLGQQLGVEDDLAGIRGQVLEEQPLGPASWTSSPFRVTIRRSRSISMSSNARTPEPGLAPGRPAQHRADAGGQLVGWNGLAM